MTNMAQTRELVEQFLTEIPQDVRSTALLIALLQKLGITDTKTLAKLSRVSERMVRHARQQVATTPAMDCQSSGNGLPKAAMDCHERQPIAATATDCRPHVRARAHFDSKPSCEVGKKDTPLPSVGPQGGKTPKAKNGTRLPADWQLPDDWRQWARLNFASVTPEGIQDQADRFADYWHAKAGRGSTMLDWQATWRNWCRKAFSGPVRNGQPMNWGRNAYDQQPKSGINWDAVDARVAELDRRVAGGRYHA